MDDLWSNLDMSDLAPTIETEAAKSKRPEAVEPPVQQRMREGIKPAQQKSPNGDQKKHRRQMSKSASEEHEMTTQPTEADLLDRLAKAATLSEAKEAGEALNEFRVEAKQRTDSERSLDWGAVSTPVAYAPPGLPMITSSGVGVHTSVDWLDAVLPEPVDSGHLANTMRAEATLWYEGQWDLLKQDPDEFKVASGNAARRTASVYGVQGPEAEQVFAEHVAHLHTKAGYEIVVEAGEYTGGSPKEGDTSTCWKDGGAIQFFDGQWMHLKGTGSDHNDVHPANKSDKERPDAFKGGDKQSALETEGAWGDDSGPDWAKTQDGPYPIPNGSKLPNPTNTDTFDGRVNGENGPTEDPKTSPSQNPSLGEGDQPEGDTAQSHTSPISDTDANYAKDNKSTTYTDPMPSGGKSSAVTAEQHSVCPQCGSSWKAGGGTCPTCGAGHAFQTKGGSILATLRETFGGGDSGLVPSDSPSLSEGDQPEGDTSAPHQNPIAGQTFDASQWGTAGQDYLNTGGTPQPHGLQDMAYASLREVGERVFGEATTENTRVFGRALATMASLDERRDVFSGHDILAMVLASGDLTEDTRAALEALAAGTVHCKVCGAAIERDPAGEKNRSWHHADGASHDHEAEPKESSSGDDTTPVPPNKNPFTGSVTATRYCPTHKVYVGEGNQENHDHCPVETRKKADAAVVPPFDREAAGRRGNDFSIEDAKNEEGEWIMSPEQIRAEMAYSDEEDPDDFYDRYGSLSTTAEARPLYEIAADIRRNWLNPYFGAKPYLDALSQLSTMDDNYYEDPASTIVAYLLSNMGSKFKGPEAARLKDELKSLQKPRRRGSVEVSSLPDCDLCRAEGNQRTAAYDGKTMFGPWANMCENHFQSVGVGLGTGRGQRLVLKGPVKETSKVSVHLTNVGFEDKANNLAKGTDPSGNIVVFKVTDKEKADLSQVLYSDLAGNFSGVDVGEDDIVKGGSLQTEAARSSACVNGNHSACTSSSCNCPCHNKKRQYSGACADGDHAECKMSHGSGPNDCACPNKAHQKTSAKTAEHSTDTSPGRWKAQVTGIGENVWSQNALTFATKEEAEAYARDLSMRWFGMDMARVVPVETPNREPVDPDDPAIVLNYR